jgi:RNA polymerase sigma-70 factor (ECF subfamily)
VDTDFATVSDIAPPAFDFETLFRAEYPRLTRAIERVVRDRGRAEELAVDAFLKLRRHVSAQGAHSPAWLRVTGVRLALNELKRQSRRARYERLFTRFASSATPEDDHRVNEEQQQVRRVLASLPRRHGELLILRNEGLSYRELGAALGLLPQSVGTTIARAQRAFQQEFVRRYGDYDARR